MNNNSVQQFVPTLWITNKKQKKIKFKRIKQNYLLARRYCCNHGKKKFDTNHYDFNKQFLRTLRAKKQQQKLRRYYTIIRDSQGRNARGKTSSLRKRFENESCAIGGIFRAVARHYRPPLPGPRCNHGWMDGPYSY